MGKKANRRIARLTRELVHTKSQLRETQIRSIDALMEAVKRIDAQDKQITAYKLGDPNELATPIHFNDFLRLVSQLPDGRVPHGSMLDMYAPPLDNAVRTISAEIPDQPDPGRKLPFRSVSYRIPVGSSSRRVDGWMLPSRVVVVDDGRRRHRLIDPLELDRLQRKAQGSRP